MLTRSLSVQRSALERCIFLLQHSQNRLWSVLPEGWVPCRGGKQAGKVRIPASGRIEVMLSSEYTGSVNSSQVPLRALAADVAAPAAHSSAATAPPWAARLGRGSPPTGMRPYQPTAAAHVSSVACPEWAVPRQGAACGTLRASSPCWRHECAHAPALA